MSDKDQSEVLGKEEFMNGMRIYSIAQVAEKTGMKESLLRKYENDYSLQIPRDGLNRRYYTDAEISVFNQIKAMKENNLNIHMIRKLLGNSEAAQEQKEQALSLATMDKITGEDFKQLIIKAVAEGVMQREEALKNEFKASMEESMEKLREELKEEIREEFRQHMEQMKGENKKLMEYTDSKRQEREEAEKKKSGFIGRLFGK